MKVLKARRLPDGKTVWLASDHSWVADREAAEVACDCVTEEKLQRAARAALCKKEVASAAFVELGQSAAMPA